MGLAKLFTRAVSAPPGWPNGLMVVGDNSSSLYGEYDGGMTLPGPWRASILLSDLLGQLPFQAYQDLADGTAEKLDPTPVILTRPNPADIAITTYSSMLLDLIWHGNSISLVADRDSNGLATAIVPVPAEWVSVRWNEGAIEYSIDRDKYSAYDVLHIKGPTRPGCLRGMGVLENHMKTLTLADEQNKQARSVGTAGVPSGVLKSTDPAFNEKDARDLKQMWGISQSQRSIAILNATTDFQPVGWNPEESQLLEARKFSLHEIALIFGLDPTWLGVAYASNTYTNIEQEGIKLNKYSLSGHLTRFEQSLSTLMPPGTWVKANVDSLLRSDTLNRYQAHKLGIEAGFLMPSEARALEDLPVIPGIDDKPEPVVQVKEEEVA